MSQPQPAQLYPVTPAPKKSKLPVIIVLVIPVIAIIGGGSFAGTRIYQASLQPNIQATAVNIGTPITNPRYGNVVDDGRVSNSVSFDYTTSLPGTYGLIWDNSFSIFTSKSVSVTYTVSGSTHTQSFTVQPGQSREISFNLGTGDRIYGNFAVSGARMM